MWLWVWMFIFKFNFIFPSMTVIRIRRRLSNPPELGSYRLYSSVRINKTALRLSPRNCHEPGLNSQPVDPQAKHFTTEHLSPLPLAESETSSIVKKDNCILHIRKRGRYCLVGEKLPPSLPTIITVQSVQQVDRFTLYASHPNVCYWVRFYQHLSLFLLFLYIFLRT